MATAVERQPAIEAPRWRVGRRTRWGLVALLLVLLAWFVRSRVHTESAVRYETVAVTIGSLSAKVTATGTLSALVTVQVGSQVSGRIADILVDFNSPVTKGQVLAHIDPLLFRAAVEQARANDLAARANLVKARSQLADAHRQAVRATALRGRRLIAQAEADTAQTQEEVARAVVGAAKAAVEQAAASLNQAEINLQYATIHSPIDGVVISRNVDVGQTVAAALQSPTLFVIAEDLRRMQVDSSVAEADVGRLTPTMEARFTVDAYPSRTFTGTVRQIRNAAQTVQNVVTYDAVIDVANEELLLKPGMTATITFVFARRDDVVRIPNAALRFRAPMEWTKDAPGPAPSPVEADRRRVWRLEAGMPRPVEVRIGVTDGSLTEQLEGALQPGDALVSEVIGARKAGPGYGRVL